MKFNYIDIPHQWKDEFTKYPHGYTIFEALCKWTKQVDDMVDNQNNWIDYLDNFVDNFEFELQEEVQSTIERWQSEGLLDDIIESALDTELDDVKTQLADADDKINTLSIFMDDYIRYEGETDDTGRFRRAVVDAELEGKTIFISGAYTISDTIELRNRVSIQGQSQSQTIIEFNGDGVAFNFHDDVNNTDNGFGYGCYYNNLSNFTLISNGLGTAFSGEPRYSYFMNVTVRGFDILFDWVNNWTNKYVNCIFANNRVWYRSGAQNNAVSFVNCSFEGGEYGFAMRSCYGVEFSGCNLENAAVVLFLPTHGGGNIWNSITIYQTYIEISGHFINTSLNALNGDEITSWQIYGFVIDGCLVQAIEHDDYIYSRIADLFINARVSNNVFFHRNGANPIFDIHTSPIKFEGNTYRYYEGGLQKNYVDPFSTYMKTWNTSFINERQGSGNRKYIEGKIITTKGLQTPAYTFDKMSRLNSLITNGTLFVDVDNKLKFKDIEGNLHEVNLTPWTE